MVRPAEIPNISLPLGVGRLTEYDQRSIWLCSEASVRAQHGGATGRLDDLFNSLKDAGGAGKIRITGLRALPGQGPTARLSRDAVRAVAGHQKIEFPLQWKHVSPIFQKYEALLHGTARERSFL